MSGSSWRGVQIYYKKLKVNDGEQRQLVDNIFKQSSTFVDCFVFFVRIVEFLTNINTINLLIFFFFFFFFFLD